MAYLVHAWRESWIEVARDGCGISWYLRRLVMSTWPMGPRQQTSYCWMREGVPEAEVLSFSEWIKTREIKVSTGNSE